MHLPIVLLCLGVLTLGNPAATSEWCYSGCDFSPAHWADISGAFCGRTSQSPVDIVPANVERKSGLGHFVLTNFTSTQALKSVEFDGHTVKCKLEPGVEVSGGGLNATYSTPQFHFHWGAIGDHPGSEHTIDGHRFPMEMHIVSLKKGLTQEEALADAQGIAVLGFFINVTEDASPEAWTNFTSYLRSSNETVNVTHDISISDLIQGVDLTKFYRYKGSLTTPNCHEVVVWTVFQEPINLSRATIDMFPNRTGEENVYRPVQPLNGRKIYASPAADLPDFSWCYDDHCDFGPARWHLLPNSFCAGTRQSPIDIKDAAATPNPDLVDFSYTHFDDVNTLKYIKNTGHTVKVGLKDDRVEVSGGGLGATYSALQFHLHWGKDAEDSAGSEHTVDSKRYPMELHIVTAKKGLTVNQALAEPNGLAVLGFFMEMDDTNTTSSGAWRTLSNYLPMIQNISTQVDITAELSLDDLLGDVDRKNYYRYNGSLTTPTCNEAVVWTVFKNPIKVEKSLIRRFPFYMGYEDVFRPRQAVGSRMVETNASCALGPASYLALLLTAVYKLLM